MPSTAITMAMTAAIQPQRFRPGGVVWRRNVSGAGSWVPASGCLSGISLSGPRWGIVRPFGGGIRRAPAMDDTEYHRHEQQGGASCEYQSADHGAAERRVLFTAFAQAERHGQHADHHGQRR